MTAWQDMARKGFCGLCNGEVLYVRVTQRRGAQSRGTGEMVEREPAPDGRWVGLPDGRWRKLRLPPVGRPGHKSHRCPPHAGRGGGWGTRIMARPYRYRVMWHPPHGETHVGGEIRGSFDTLAEAVAYIDGQALECAGVYDNDLQLWVPGL